MARPEVILHFLLVAVGSMCKVCNFADVLQISQGVHWGAPLLLPLFGGVQGGRAPPPWSIPGPLGLDGFFAFGFCLYSMRIGVCCGDRCCGNTGRSHSKELSVFCLWWPMCSISGRHGPGRPRDQICHANVLLAVLWAEPSETKFSIQMFCMRSGVFLLSLLSLCVRLLARFP